MKRISLLLGGFAFSIAVFAQDKDKGTFIETKPGYYQNSILKGIQEFEETKKEEAPHKVFKVDVSNKNYPTDPESYTKVWHTGVISQGNTGTCWCFSTTSYYETEIKRLSGKEIKLSEMYTVYWEYVERARYFVRNRGTMALGEGSQTMAVAKNMKKYGIVPASVYTGMKSGQKFHTHAKMYEELEAYLKGVKVRGEWNEEAVVATVRSILDFHMGAVPSKFSFEGKEYTPGDFLKNVTKLNPDDYVDFMSLMTAPYWEKALYDVPDNWVRSKDFINVPLDVFMDIIKSSIKAGYGISIGGDVSEAGFHSWSQVAVVPTFDIPSEYIDESARAFRFLNNTTTDDHAMHLVGYKEVNGKTWFLIKDSGSGSRNCGEGCKSFGYYFFHEDYIKLKMMTFTIHKDAVKEVLKKVKA